MSETEQNARFERYEFLETETMNSFFSKKYKRVKFKFKKDHSFILNQNVISYIK
jgi:hypothetical protein